MRQYSEKEQNNISLAIKMIKTWKRNVRFIKDRIDAQKRNDFVNNGRRKYHQIDVDVEQYKIDKAKELIERI